jgi:hypothetical protein
MKMRRTDPAIAQTISQAATPKRSLVHVGPAALSIAPAKLITAAAALTTATTTNGLKNRRKPSLLTTYNAEKVLQKGNYQRHSSKREAKQHDCCTADSQKNR